MLQTAAPQYAPDAQPRYDRYIQRAKLAVTAANKSVKRYCT